MTGMPPPAAPLLSVCVPTYKRPLLLSVSLRAILSQLTPEMAQAVEVVVLDNASPDETPAVVQQARADFPAAAVRYVRRPENIGADANFCTASAEAAGEFVYLVSDDDVLLPGAVAKLLEVIRKYPDLDAVALNVRVFTDDPYHDLGLSPAYILPEDALLTGRDAALSLLRMHLTFLSCIAFRRANVLGRDYSARYGTVLAQAFLFLDALSPGNGLYAVKQPFLARRDDNNQGFDFFEVFVTNFQPVLLYARTLGYSPQAVQKVMENNLVFLRHCVLLFKTNGAIGTIRPNYPDAFRRIWRTYGLHPALLLAAAPMLVPRPLFREGYRVYKKIKSRVVRSTPSAQHAQ